MNMPVSKIVEDIRRIKVLCQKILEKIDAGQLEGSKKELEQLLELDVDEAQHLGKDVEDEELLQHTRAVLQAAREAIQSIEGHKQSSTARELIQKIILLENYDLTKILNFEKFGEQALQHLLLLLEKQTLSEEEKKEFLMGIKGKVSPKVYKRIEKKLKEKVETENKQQLYSTGPTYRDKDILYLREKINMFFSSPYAQRLSKGEKITFYIFGSLVNGFCNNPRKPAYGKPSDMGRISDVDILIVLSPTLWNEITRNMSPKQIVTINNTERTNPVGLDTTPGVESTGAFMYLFHYLKDIAFAGRKDRPVHVVFIMKKWFLELNLRNEPHIHVMDTLT